MRNKQHACSKYSDMYPLTNSVSTIRQYKTTRLGHLSKDILFSLKKKKKRKKREERKQKQSSVLYRSVYIYIYTDGAKCSTRVFGSCDAGNPHGHRQPFRSTHAAWPPSGWTCSDLSSGTNVLHADILQDQQTLTFRINMHWPPSLLTSSDLSSGSTRTAHWPLQGQQALTYFQDEHALTFMINMPRPIFRINKYCTPTPSEPTRTNILQT